MIPTAQAHAESHDFDAVIDVAPQDDSPCILPASCKSSVPPLSYHALQLLSRQLTAGLTTMFAQGRIACALPNGSELAALLAVLPSSGSPFAPLNPELQLEEMTWELSDVPARAIIVLHKKRANGEMMDDSEEVNVNYGRVAAERLGLPIVELEPSPVACGLFSISLPSELPTQQPTLPPPPPLPPGHCGVTRDAGEHVGISPGTLLPRSRARREDVALVMHTSGTTRRPKVVPIIHRHLASGVLCVVSTLKLTRQDTCLNAMPLFHLHGLMVNVVATLAAGASVCCLPTFDATDFVARLRPAASASPSPNADDGAGPGHKAASASGSLISWYSAVPTIHLEVLRAAEDLNQISDPHKASAAAAANVPPAPQSGIGVGHTLTVIRNCSAALAPAISQRMEAALPGVEVLPTYGMTEALPICATARGASRASPMPASCAPVASLARRTPPQRDLASVGCAMGPEVAVLGPAPEDALLLAGAEGEVGVRGTCVMAGYEQRDHLGYDPNDGAFATGGWLRTGDKGWLDEHRRLFLSGRFKEVINRAGEKVSPLAVEHALLEDASTRLPGLVSLLVFAAPHEELGEAVGAAITVERPPEGEADTAGASQRPTAGGVPAKRSAAPVTLKQLRAAAMQGGALSARWLPELLVVVDALPKGPTGKPMRIGLAERLKLPMLCFRKSFITLDRRGAADVPSGGQGDDEAMDPNAEPPREPPPEPALGSHGLVRRSVRHYLMLVLHAIHAVSGNVLDADDSLAESAGLSSLTVARMRVALEGKVGVPLPAALLLRASTARALAAGILRHVREASPREHDKHDHNDDDDDDDDDEEEDGSMLMADAEEQIRGGELSKAEALCVRAAGCMALSLPPAPDQPPRRAHVPLLLLLGGVHDRLGRRSAENGDAAASARHDAMALACYRALLEALGPAHQDAFVVHAQEMAVLSRGGDVAGAARAEQASVSAAAAADIKAVHAAVAAVGRAWLKVPDALPTSVTCARLSTLQLVTLPTEAQLDRLPPAISAAKLLRSLDVSGNHIPWLPHSVASLRELRDLNVSGNDLADLPLSLAEMPNLHVLSMQGNCFARLPAVVYSCKKLRSFKWGAQRTPDARVMARHRESSISTNASQGTERGVGAPALCSTMLAVLELEVNGQPELPQLNTANTVLTSLLASFNRLGSAPTQLSAFAGCLKKLHLGCNEIPCVASLLTTLTRLVELTLEGNRLSSLPAAIGGLKRLKELWVHGNQISRLPDELGKCASLTVLQCHHNLLAELPDAMRQLSKLQGLYMQSNLLSDLPGLRARVLDHLPLQNLGLGNNRLDIAHAFERPGCRVGLAWNAGCPPPSLSGRLSMWFAAVDHVFEPACAGVRGQLLLVAFSAQGPGMQQWLAPVASARSVGMQLDALYVADPSNSYYLQDPSGGWDGVSYYGALVRHHAAHYKAVLLLGSSMGASACLHHCDLASRAIAFAPRVDLSASHGAYIPKRAREAGLQRTMSALTNLHARGGVCTVHAGRTNYVDTAQVAHVAHMPSVAVEAWPTFHHNVPAFLEREGRLVPLIKRELVALLRMGSREST
jgi:acyl-CoA synthetase (AMP-forming)/AMP-acid ligase II/Leucine-rich repeat (LRR) protein